MYLCMFHYDTYVDVIYMYNMAMYNSITFVLIIIRTYNI